MGQCTEDQNLQTGTDNLRHRNEVNFFDEKVASGAGADESMHIPKCLDPAPIEQTRGTLRAAFGGRVSRKPSAIESRCLLWLMLIFLFLVPETAIQIPGRSAQMREFFHDFRRGKRVADIGGHLHVSCTPCV